MSLAIVIACSIFALIYGGMAGLKWSAGLLLPLALIWFPEEIGSITGYYRSGYVNVQTPASIVSMLGWCILIGLPVLAYLLR